MLHGLSDKRREKNTVYMCRGTNRRRNKLRFMFFSTIALQEGGREGGRNSLYKVEGVLKKDLMAAALFR